LEEELQGPANNPFIGYHISLKVLRKGLTKGGKPKTVIIGIHNQWKLWREREKRSSPHLQVLLTREGSSGSGSIPPGKKGDAKNHGHG